MLQIKIITTRLIEISMKVDDYVYKHIPISETDAEKYMREVSAYKDQCGRDQRSLQVRNCLSRYLEVKIYFYVEDCSVDIGTCNTIMSSWQKWRLGTLGFKLQENCCSFPIALASCEQNNHILLNKISLTYESIQSMIILICWSDINLFWSILGQRKPPKYHLINLNPNAAYIKNKNIFL